MSAEWVGALTFVVGVIFAAGILRSEVKQLRTDLNGIGKKARKLHTVQMVIIAQTDDRIERFKLVSLFKED
jgi:hypothetical protein